MDRHRLSVVTIQTAIVVLSLGALVACGGPRRLPTVGATAPEQSTYPAWFEKAFAHLAGNFVNPVSTSSYLKCVIKFTVVRSGEVRRIELIEPSGNETFDAACLNSIERGSPFPPLPEDFPEDTIAITVPFANR